MLKKEDQIYNHGIKYINQHTQAELKKGYKQRGLHRQKMLVLKSFNALLQSDYERLINTKGRNE